MRVEAAGDLFQPRREIDGGTDAGEVEPVAAADIAEQNPADMQRDAEAETLDGFAIGVAHRLDAGAGFPRGLQHAPADLRQYCLSSSAIGNTASSPSPMNFRTSPPCVRIAGTWQSK